VRERLRFEPRREALVDLRFDARDGAGYTAGMRLPLSCCLLAAWASVARAQDPPIDGNDFSIDAVATPVLASSRITGLAGAYTALADGIDGVPWNPAGYASRTLWELSRFEYDITASILLGGSFGENDYFLNGRGDGFGIEDFVFVDLGARLQFGSIGAGVLFQLQNYALPARDDGTPAASVSLLSIHAGAGYGLFDGQLVIGGGARGIRFDTSIVNESEAFVLSGVGLEVGSVFRHERLPFRVGAAFRTPVRSVVVEDPESGETPTQVAGLWRPERVELPWEVQAGFAIQVGPRPLNRRFRPKKDVSRGLRAALRAERCARELEQVKIELAEAGETLEVSCPRLRRRARDPRWREAERVWYAAARERLEDEIATAEAAIEALWDELYEALPRRHLLVSVDLLLHGPVGNAIGIDAFLDQTRRRRGDGWSTTFRLGLEGEPWAHRLKLRVGTYVEQARYAGVSARVHGTAGFDLRLFSLFGKSWRATFVVDGARDYVSWGVSVGVWH